MITANTIDCSTETTYPTFIELMPGWSTTVSCKLPEVVPESVNYIPAIVDVVTAIATLAAVVVAVWQTWRANNATKTAEAATKDANAAAKKANDFLIQKYEEDQKRQASRVVAWVGADAASSRGRAFIRNASDEPVFRVVIRHANLGSEGRWEIPVLPPGLEKNVLLNSRMEFNQNLLYSLPLEFTDALGHEYSRDGESGDLLKKKNLKQAN